MNRCFYFVNNPEQYGENVFYECNLETRSTEHCPFNGDGSQCQELKEHEENENNHQENN